MKLLFTSLLLFVSFNAPLAAQSSPDWPAIPPADLTTTDLPEFRGAPAAILELRNETDNEKGYETRFIRIKILNETGLKYANVELTYVPKVFSVDEIRARTISPSGEILPFAGEIMDSILAKAHKAKVSARTFTLPKVGVGSIIDYSYRVHWNGGFTGYYEYASSRTSKLGCYSVLAADWVIQHDLFLRHGIYVLHGKKGTVVQWFKVAMKDSENPVAQPDNGYILEVRNVPPSVEEEFSPPAEGLRSKIRMLYVSAVDCTTNLFWAGTVAHTAPAYEAFLERSKAIDREASRIVSPTDSDEQKLRKIYARVQQIRSLSVEPEKTEKQSKQEHLKQNNNVQDVLEHGYGYSEEINLLYIALARAAGLQSQPVKIRSRDLGPFIPGLQDISQLTDLIVGVRSGSDWSFLDPGTPFCPFGILPQEKMGASGLRYDAAHPGFITTQSTGAEDASSIHTGDFSLDSNGNLKGTMEVAFGRLQSMDTRLAAIGKDDSSRIQSLETAIQPSLPQGATLKTTSAESWTATDQSLKAKFQVDIPDFASAAGKRLLLPVAVFRSVQSNSFSAATRQNPVNFDYPYASSERDSVSIPDSLEIESVPPPYKEEFGPFLFSLSIEKQGNHLTINRNLMVNANVFSPAYYPVLRTFFSHVREKEEQQVALREKSTAKPQ